MNSVYQQYSDDIAIIALNPYSSDTESAIKTYQSANGLAFPMAKTDTAIVNAFGVEAYPTSVVIDRYGMISVIEVGAIVSEAPFVAAYEHFISENYTQRLEESLQAFVEVPKPDTDMLRITAGLFQIHFALCILHFALINRRRPSRSSCQRACRSMRRSRPASPVRRGCSGKTYRQLPSSSAHNPARRTTWS